MPREGVGIQTAGLTAGWATTGATGAETTGFVTTVRGALRSALVSFATAGAVPTARTATAIAMLLPRTIRTPDEPEFAFALVIGLRHRPLERTLVMTLCRFVSPRTKGPAYRIQTAVRTPRVVHLMPGRTVGRVTEVTGATARWPAAGATFIGVTVRGTERSAVSRMAATAGVATRRAVPTVRAIHRLRT
jgi:hypothetical protein